LSYEVPARRLNFLGEVQRNHEAIERVLAPGDAMLVARERPRSIVLACPDGCGDHLTINLDAQAGPAWRVYRRSRGLTLFPSVWRESGCKSHFVVWHDTILWCDRFTEENVEPDDRSPDLRQKVLEKLTDTYQSYVDVALALDELPWEVNRCCQSLTSKGLVEEAPKPTTGEYRLA
jgi:hypothetical protein